MHSIAFEPTSFYILSRCLSGTYGVLTILVVYFTALLLRDRRNALIAAFLISICYLHVRDSHFGTIDVSMTFWSVLAVYFMLRAYNTGGFAHYAFAGIAAGFATGTKYGAVLLIFPMAAAHLMRILEESSADDQQRGGRFRGSLRFSRTMVDAACRPQIWLFVLVLLSTFAFSTPFAIMELPSFLADFLFEVGHLDEGHKLVLGRGWWHHIRYTLPYGMGLLLFLSSLAGG